MPHRLRQEHGVTGLRLILNLWFLSVATGCVLLVVDALDDLGLVCLWGKHILSEIGAIRS